MDFGFLVTLTLALALSIVGAYLSRKFLRRPAEISRAVDAGTMRAFAVQIDGKQEVYSDADLTLLRIEAGMRASEIDCTRKPDSPPAEEYANVVVLRRMIRLLDALLAAHNDPAGTSGTLSA